ncbi:MAG TPA: hypothetical protein VFE60_11685, partial [Roseiarcus sp.]|nr:hypothetical protein [Roseiarcus sp.]
LYRRALGSWAPLRSRQAADEAQTLRFPHRSLFALLHPEFREFSHGLHDLCTATLAHHRQPMPLGPGAFGRRRRQPIAQRQ